MGELLDPTDENLDRAAACVRDGGVVVAPSDTNLALTIEPWHADAIDRVYGIKDRPPEKPLTLFVRDPADWREFGSHEHPDLVEEVIDAFWPGPLNLVLERTERVHDERLCRGETVAIGCLANSVWRDLADRVGGPLAMTSANRSGAVDDDTLVDVDLAVEHVGDEADYILDSEPEGTTRASTILDLVYGPSILRRGDVTRETLQERTSLVLD